MAEKRLRFGVSKRLSIEFSPPLNQEGTPERKLIAAILYRAINDTLTDTTKDPLCTRKEKLGAIQWIFDEENITPFSFLWICDHLDLNPSKIRRRCRKFIQMRRENKGLKRKSNWSWYLTKLEQSKS